MKRVAPAQIISFLVLVACGALGQGVGLSGEGSNLPTGRLPDQMPAWGFLPNAPSVQFAIPLTVNAAAVNLDVVREREFRTVSFGPEVGFSASDKTLARQKDPIFFDKYLYPSLRRGELLRYHPSTSNSLMGRAVDAASRIFVTRDDSGKGKLNTSYFLGTLTSVTIDNAYRPYWSRSASGTFSNFGSTIGSDAGTNLLHEFGPGIRQMLQSHAPKFLSNLVAHYQNPR